ncbi:MAG TPA: metallophosphoesterase family protein [Solirubrobacteraceae bacterium]|nr:metallophosphoesterase family protein [Solirubrobacteraceae bacterium]
MPVRLAIISDTHLPRGRRALPEACVQRLQAADAILHAGDFMAVSVLRELEALGPPVHAVHGNVDDADLRAVLPEARVVHAGGARIAMLHDAGPAAGRLGRLHRRFPGADAAVFGHSHLPLHEHGREGFQILNPGSPTERRRAPRHTMGLAVIEDGRARFELIALE